MSRQTLENATLQARRRAATNARRLNEPFAVIDIDNGEDGRAVECRPLDYCDTDEFIAFDGRILSIHYPDGTSE